MIPIDPAAIAATIALAERAFSLGGQLAKLFAERHEWLNQSEVQDEASDVLDARARAAERVASPDVDGADELLPVVRHGSRR